MRLLQIVSISLGVLVPVVTSVMGAERAEVGQARMTATLTLPDGTSRTVKVDGVGCTRSICSRTEIRGKVDSVPQTFNSVAFDAIDTIQGATPDRVRFVLKDGTQQKMSLVTDFRVLYLRDESGNAQKLDLSKIKSLQFAAQQ